MRAGVFLAYWPWFSPSEQVELAVLADGLGLDSVWISEAWGQDAVSVLGHLSARTERIALGSGLFQIPARAPTTTAMAAASLDVLSGGRFRLGLGVSGPQVSEGWYGVPFARLERAGRSREAIDVAACTAVAIEDDLDAARDAVRPWLAFYLGAMGSKEKNFYVELAARAGHGDAALACQEAFLGGDRERAAAALTPELIDSMALATTPGALDDRLAAFAGVGVDTLVGVPCGTDRARVVRTLAEATR